MDLARNLLNVNDADDEDENDVDADEHGMVVMVELKLEEVLVHQVKTNAVLFDHPLFD